VQHAQAACGFVCPVVTPQPLGNLGKYTLVRKLATGGMAEVFLARADGPMGFQKKCVVKRILPHFNDDERFIQMFLAEARLAAELNHPNLVQIFDFGQHNGQYYLAMEFIDGPNTRSLNQAVRKATGAMDFAVAARLIATAAEGLHFAHELRDENGTFLNLVHRDISPDNILVSRNGAVKVVDFGIAKASTQPHLTKSGMIKGKMAYMPPEQLARDPLDRRADLFALGIVLYEMITGGMPFDATSEVSIIQAIMSVKPLERVEVYRPDCPVELQAIVMRCLEKDRERRYPSCRELQTDLEAFIQSTGKVVGTREIAALVSSLFAEAETSTSGPKLSPSQSGSDAMTRPSGSGSVKRSQSASIEVVPEDFSQPSVTSTGLSGTALREVPERPGSNKAPLFVIGGALTVGLLGGAAWLLTRPPPPIAAPPPPVVTAHDAPKVLVVDASVDTDLGPDAGAPDAAEPDAGEPEVGIDAGQPAVVDAGAAATPTEAVKAKGKLSLRIRPYATVFLDDKPLGDTPLPSLAVPVGKHKLKLVNPTLGTVTLEITIKPGDNVIKHNFKE
jgi:serine/threonine protein kinase